MATMIDVVCANPRCGKQFQRKLRQYNESKTKHFYCSRQCVAQAAHDQHGSGIPIPTKEELEHMLHIERMTYTQIAQIYNVDQSAVYYWRKQLKISSRKTWLDIYGDPVNLCKLVVMYESGATLNDVAEAYGANRSSVRQLFRHNGIPIRSDGFDGKRYQTQNGQQVRSSYECKVANWLAEHGIEYTYEPSLPFSARGKSDFLANGWYIEVWGVINSPSYKARKQEKINLYRTHDIPLLGLPAHSFDPKRNGLWERKLSTCITPPTTVTYAECQPRSWGQMRLALEER